MDRARALAILGLADSGRSGSGPEEDEIRAAHRALRAHIEARAGASEDEAFRAARREELADLERAVRTLSTLVLPARSPEPVGADPAVRGQTPRWLLAWAVVATLCAAGLLFERMMRDDAPAPRVLVEGDGDGEGGGEGEGFAIPGAAEAEGGAGGAPADARSAGPRAKVVAASPVEGALLEVRSRDEAQDVVAEGAADETVYWLSPGAYALRVHHPDCEDEWRRELDVAGEGEYRFEPGVCTATGFLVVRSNVGDDALSIDGQPVGPTGEQKRPVAAGEHAVRVEKAGYQAWEGIVDVAPGQLLAIRPRLERSAGAIAKPPAPPPAPAPAAVPPPGQAAAEEERKGPDESWHEEARQWLLARYDLDRSGALDTREEVELVPCDQWLGLEQAHDRSGLGLSLTRFYGFDGHGWRSGALGVSDEMRDVAHLRLRACGLR